MWFLFPESSHTLSPKALILKFGFMCEKFYDAHDILRKDSVNSLPLHHFRRGAEAKSSSEGKCTLIPTPLHLHWEINWWGKRERKVSKFIKWEAPWEHRDYPLVGGAELAQLCLQIARPYLEREPGSVLVPFYSGLMTETVIVYFSGHLKLPTHYLS